MAMIVPASALRFELSWSNWQEWSLHSSGSWNDTHMHSKIKANWGLDVVLYIVDDGSASQVAFSYFKRVQRSTVSVSQRGLAHSNPKICAHKQWPIKTIGTLNIMECSSNHPRLSSSHALIISNYILDEPWLVNSLGFTGNRWQGAPDSWTALDLLN